jgi:hypothetical protein
MATDANDDEKDATPSMLWELFSSPQYFSTICARHVLPRTNETTVKFLTHARRDVRENVLKIRGGEENVPDYFLLIECASRESIELGWNAMMETDGITLDALCEEIISCAREGKNIHPLFSTHALEESELRRNELEEQIADLAENDLLDICECCERTYHTDYIVTFSRGYLKPANFGGNGKVRCLNACGKCFDKYVPKGFGHPDVKEGGDDRDDWVSRDYCECCDQYYHATDVTWINRGFKNAKGRTVYSACPKCFDKYV